MLMCNNNYGSNVHKHKPPWSLLLLQNIQKNEKVDTTNKYFVYIYDLIYYHARLRCVICKFIFFCFRHVHPSKDNLAAKSLSEPRQIRNVRKVKVNAQVTFVIYILESVANFSIFVVWFFVNQRNSNLTLTLGVLWFNVILSV